MIHECYAFADVRPTPQELESALGYPEGGASAGALRAINDVLQDASDLWSIEGGCAVYPEVSINRRRQAIAVQGLRFDVGAIVCGRLFEVESLAAFLCTAGRGIEDLSRRLTASGDALAGFISDTLGSVVVEKAMDRLQDRLAQVAGERGMRITARYSPGYCGWNVAEQRKLFRLLPPFFCGVRLLESSLMQPIKTVSGFIGLGARVTRQPYGCSLCDVEDCLFRRLRSGKTATPADDKK
ncbi:MAG: hypothetical protein JXO72_00120 [Vicinamibacteria bacterium]|nr:hypothetical protein [Vicinamibacteria bacterium]